MREKVIISLIALNLLLQGFLWITIGIAYSPLFFVFGAWGMINAVVLFFRGFISTVTALVWHSLYVGFIFVRLLQVGQVAENQSLYAWWAVIDLAAIFYLAKVIVRDVRHHNESHTGDSLW